jgi:hypothetical protein
LTLGDSEAATKVTVGMIEVGRGIAVADTLVIAHDAAALGLVRHRSAS